jgi:cobalamin-dependent methionine synthase I
MPPVGFEPTISAGDQPQAHDLDCTAKSMIGTILKIKEEIKSARVVKGISGLSSSRYNITEQMETLLLVWIYEKQMAGDSVSEVIIRRAQVKVGLINLC